MQRLFTTAMGRSSGSAERPPESITAAMADNFVIHDADDKDMDDKDMDDDKDWDIQIQHAPTAPEGTIWHRYQDPESKETWFSCVTLPELWCYESEIRHVALDKDGIGHFRFAGRWQKVEKAPPLEPTPASSTAVIHPNTTDGNGTVQSTEEASSAVQPASDNTEPRSASSAAQPASDTAAAQLVSAPKEVVLHDDSQYDDDLREVLMQSMTRQDDSSSDSMERDRAATDRQSNSLSSAEQPASDSAAAQLASAIHYAMRHVGAHNLETIWTCSECNPGWYNWYCRVCKRCNKYLRWSPRKHFGHCGMCCSCCRSATGEHGWCEECDALWNLKTTCPTMRDLVKTYNGL